MITKEDLVWYQELQKSKDLSRLLHIDIIDEIMNNDDVDQIQDEKLLYVANIVKECYLKDEAGYKLGEIVEAVLLNCKDIKEGNYSPREILIKFM